LLRQRTDIADDSVPEQMRMGREQMLEGVKASRDQLDQDLTRRVGDFKLKTVNAKPLEKYRWAVRREYRVTTPDNRTAIDPRGYGLVQIAIEALEEALQEKNRKSLHPLEFLEASQQLLNYLLLSGQLAEASMWLNELGRDLGGAAIDFELYRTGCLGRYGDMMKLLKVREEQQVPAAAIKQRAVNAARLGFMPLPGSLPLYVALTEDVRTLSMQRLYAFTLHGIVALEAGDTGLAREMFEKALNEAGPSFNFPDRQIAERYLGLLKQHEAR
jgi:hypothetical protein